MSERSSSSNWNLAIILVSLFLSCLGGWIMYAVKTNDKSLDLRVSKKALIIITILDVIAVITLIVLFTVVFVHHVTPVINY
ncbi:MAG: hypothetical protein LBG49_00620 [Mycoplasmataceae bacterium]|jgi:hypothetical protein|nr:hypothetical protein [Mycoplasmataceae bacterium]